MNMIPVFAAQSKKLFETVPLKKGVICFIGSGGKTSLIRALAKDLSANSIVVVLTTTRMYAPPEMYFCGGKEKQVRSCLHFFNPLCIGKPIANNKITVPDVSIEDISEIADYVLVEADGAKHHPLKMPNATEPVYTDRMDSIICVQGLSGIGKTYAESCFRKEQAEKMLGRSEHEVISPRDVAQMCCAPGGLLWNAPQDVPITVVLNQADTDRERAYATEAASYMQDSGISSVIAISLKNDFGGRYARFC